jgi:2-polyprenyl-3-methyl-5-hydroxy-6-metoxy-1,4-benzoquinol methylase
VSDESLRARARSLGPWYQNIQLTDAVSTKDLGGAEDIFADADIPGPLWQIITRDLGPLDGLRVLDIGCNAGYMSFESKRLGASFVLGIDNDLGATTSFIEQAEFCRRVLDLNVEFRKQSMFDDVAEAPFDIVLFAGVLYHLENWADSLDRLHDLAVRGTGRIVLETATEPVTQTFYEGRGYNGDTSTFFVPSMRVLLAAVEERGFRVLVARDLGARGLLFLAPA